MKGQPMKNDKTKMKPRKSRSPKKKDDDACY
jgi:hypothetical protein